MASNRVIATAGLVAISVGSANAVFKHKQLPSTKFLIGSGVAFLILSALSEAEPELANAFAIAIATTVVLGDGGGVLSYINNGEMDTKKGATRFTPDAPKEPPTSTDLAAAPYRMVPAGGTILTPRPNMN